MNRALAVLALCLPLAAPLTAWAVESNQPGPLFPALEGQRGKVVLVDFWASWCGPCRQALPAYESLRRQFGAKGFEVIAVDVDQEPRQGAALLRQMRLSYVQVADPQGEIAQAYDVPGMPAAYLIDRRGTVRQVHLGFEDQDIEPLKQAVAKLVEEK
jgi:cytochrome c biogenesis protein CcmG/thiol:disulfide interchange protein DsbE